MPHTVVRLYEDSGPLVSTLRTREAEVREIMTGVPGFISYSIVDTGKGAVSITTCESKEGTDDSIARAAEWIMTNLPDAKIDSPEIINGELLFRFVAEGHVVDSRTRPHVAMRIFREHPPEEIRNMQGEIRTTVSAVPGFIAYTVINVDGADASGITVIAAQDKAAADAVSQAMGNFVSTKFPGFKRAHPPRLVEAEGVFRFEAQPTPA
jgi:hypothetical protein